MASPIDSDSTNVDNSSTVSPIDDGSVRIDDGSGRPNGDLDSSSTDLDNSAIDSNDGSTELDNTSTDLDNSNMNSNGGVDLDNGSTELAKGKSKGKGGGGHHNSSPKKTPPKKTPPKKTPPKKTPPKKTPPKKTPPKSKPKPNPPKTTRPKTGGGGSCTFTDYNSFKSKVSSCSQITIGNLAVPAGETLDFGKLNNAKIVFQGKVTFGYKEWRGPLVLFGGKGLQVSFANGAVLDGGGSRWWDHQGGNGGKAKPKFFWIHDVQDSTFTGVHIIDSPVHTFSIADSSNVRIVSTTISNANGEARGAHNTDGFGISRSTGITIQGGDIDNQDDCVVINSGTNLLISDLTCKGSHGLSVGVGAKSTTGGQTSYEVRNVIFKDSKLIGGENAVRIKTAADTKYGLVSNVKWSNIAFSGITKYGIDVEQNYHNSGSTGEPTNGVKITGVTFVNVRGSVVGDAVPVHILCGKGSCTNFESSGVQITGGGKSSCVNSPKLPKLC